MMDPSLELVSCLMTRGPVHARASTFRLYPEVWVRLQLGLGVMVKQRSERFEDRVEVHPLPTSAADLTEVLLQISHSATNHTKAIPLPGGLFYLFGKVHFFSQF